YLFIFTKLLTGFTHRLINAFPIGWRMWMLFAESIKNKYGEDESYTSVWDSTMSELKCCGYNNYSDFMGSPFESTASLYPVTCCRSSSGPCNENEAKRSVVGCFNALVNLIEDNAVLLAGVALGIAALEIAAMVVSMILYTNVGK
uniref:Tetraspanin 34 n=1 Tax=Sinocyclocheilus rhinocerous TaxID=307959 RepID=A0A673FS27_9TELE